MTAQMNDVVRVVPYDPSWPIVFESEAENIRHALGDNCIEVHHIGSTAVVGLQAKPIIDMLPVVQSIQSVDRVSQELIQLGYVAKGEYGIPFRRYFQKGAHPRTHHIHIFEQGNPEIERHLKFRNWLASHDDDREHYAQLKSVLADKFPNDIHQYCLGKDAFIAEIEAKTGCNGFRMVSALTDREWAAARRLRQRNFFDKAATPDPYIWTFEDPSHKHFIFYQGAAIVGYAHIQLWPEHRAALRIIVIDEAHRDQGLGSEFLNLCERWLSHQDRTVLLVQSSPEAYRFYCANGYSNMPFNDPDGYETDPRDIELGKKLGSLD